MRRIEEAAFVIVTNGFRDGPAHALRDYLVARQARRVTVVIHPLERGSGRHCVSTYERGRLVRERAYALPSRPPITYPIDLLVPIRIPRCDAWFGFNNLACFGGLVRRRVRRADKAFYWAVDFVPDRFGPGIVTRAYDSFDRLASRAADARIELSRAALDARSARLGLDPGRSAHAVVAPMGAWIDRAPTVTADAWERRRVAYLGYMVERQGVAVLLEALAALDGVAADIVGTGPLEERLKVQAARLGLRDRVVFHGLVEDHRRVEEILAGATVAAAPYVDAPDNFARFADPGKLKAYLAAGLPIVLTSVPPNAAEIEDAGAGIVVDGSAAGLAGGIETLLDDRARWQEASNSALALARRFDWNRILADTLLELGFE